MRVNSTIVGPEKTVYDRDYIIDYTSAENNDIMEYNIGHYQGQGTKPVHTLRYLYNSTGDRLDVKSTIFSQWGGSDTTYALNIHEDIMGSATAYTYQGGWNNGQWANKHEYDVWGFNTKAPTYNYDPMYRSTEPYYTGHPYDGSLNIYFAENRFYDAETGTWLSPDPIKDGLNWYVYCNANPTSYVDPDGRFAISTLLIIAGVTAVISAAVDVGVQMLAPENEGKTFEERLKTVDPLEVAISAGVGAIGGAVATITSVALMGMAGFGTLAYSSTTTIGTSILNTIAISSASSVAAGVATRTARSVAEGKSAKEILYNAVDPVSVAIDTAVGVVGGAVSSAIAYGKKVVFNPNTYKSNAPTLTEAGYYNPYTSCKNSADDGGSEAQGVGNSVNVEGRGSTGRTIPNTLNEQMAMHQVKSNPLQGAHKISLEMADPRWPASEGWVKMESVVRTSDGKNISIHYVYNEVTGAFDDFKFT